MSRPTPPVDDAPVHVDHRARMEILVAVLLTIFLTANGVPQPIVEGLAAAGGSVDGELTGVGVDLGAQVLEAVPAAQRPAIEPFIGQIVDGIHQAFSIAIANALWLGLAGALASTVIIALFVPELTLRHTPGAGAPRRQPAMSATRPGISAQPKEAS